MPNLTHQTNQTNQINQVNQMNHPTLDYLAIFKGLNEAGVDYLVIGGLAVNFYGVPRMTYDIDFAMDLDSENLLKAIRRLQKWGYKPRVPVDPEDLADPSIRDSWVKDKRMRAFTFHSESLPIGEIDIVFHLPVPYTRLKARAVYLDIQGVKVPVVSIQDLIRLKLHSGREQDLADVEYLKMIMERK